MSRQSRELAERRGKRAEFLCVWALRLKGYRILARQWRSPAGEIDIVTRRGRIVAVIEVKARPKAGGAIEALRPRQRRRIARAAGHFVAARPALAGCMIRFDVMLVVPGRWPRHVRNAWLESDA
jgi:putative endonuclease